MHPLLASRVSHRSFDAGRPISDTQLETLLEAARSAPSAYNFQPWRMLVAQRGSADFAAILASLADYNAVWAKDASAFVVGIGELSEPDGTPHPWMHYDLGQATAYLTFQATANGIGVCQLAGFDPAALDAHYALSNRFSALIVSALGFPLPLAVPTVAGVKRTRKTLAQLTSIDQNAE